MSQHEANLLQSFIITENCIIAEIHRLATLLPGDFLNPSSSPFAKLLVDFSHFENTAHLEKHIESPEGRVLDAQFNNKFGGYLRMFADLLVALGRLLEGYVSYTEGDARRGGLFLNRIPQVELLRCQTLHLLAVMMLLMHEKFPGVVKEYLFVASHRTGYLWVVEHDRDGSWRYNRNEFHHGANLDRMVTLFRNRKEPYEACLKALGVDATFACDCLSFLRQCDHAGTQGSGFDRRQSASRLSGMVYTTLLFNLDVLEGQFFIMRQIVDRHFVDSVVVPLHLELVVNLSDKWAPHRAASAALSHLANPASIAKIYTTRLTELNATPIPTGGLSIEAIGEYAGMAFKYSSALRWLVLHTPLYRRQSMSAKPSRHKTQPPPITDEPLLPALARIAFFEHKFRQSCNYLIERKEEQCERLKLAVESLIEQILTILSNPILEMGKDWNEKLKDWLLHIKTCVREFDAESRDSIHLLRQMREKILEVSEVHSHGTLLVLKQYLDMVATKLNHLINVCVVDRAFMQQFDEETDSVYLYSRLDEWTPSLEVMLRSEAPSVKYIFLKISASFGNLLFGVGKEEKLAVLSSFYNGLLGEKLISTIQVIPRAIFAEMSDLPALFARSIPTQIEKEKLRQFADHERRRKLAEKTHAIARLSLGISNMAIRRLGCVEINSRQLLEDGFQVELRRKLRAILLSDASKETNVIVALRLQSDQLASLRRGLLYVCEHISMNGAGMWETELSCVLRSAIEAQKVRNDKDELPAPVPVRSLPTIGYGRRDLVEVLIHSLVSMSDPKTTFYVPYAGEWYSTGVKRLEFTHLMFDIVESWIPANALTELHNILSYSLLVHTKSMLRELQKSTAIPPMPSVLNAAFISQLTASAEFNRLHSSILDSQMRIGQLVLIREALYRCIAKNGVVEAPTLLSSVSVWLGSLTAAHQCEESPAVLNSHDLSQLTRLLVRLGLGARVRKRLTTRSTARICVALLTSLLISLRPQTSKKHIYAGDLFVAMVGVAEVLERLGGQATETFSALTTLFLNTAQLAKLPHSRAILPNKQLYI